MSAPTIIGVAMLAFAGTHLVLGQPPVRDQLARRLGESRFVALFTGLAAITFGVLTAALAWIGGEGPAGPALGREPTARMLLSAVAFAGFALAIGGIVNYGRSPMRILTVRIHPPSGIERVTRHPFFVGFGLFAAVHALLAPTMAVCIFFGGLAALSLAGVVAQDRKLLARHGAPYADYAAATSVVPFAALLRRRQAFTREDSWLRVIVLPTAIALVFLLTHAVWSAYNGATFAGLVLAGGAFATVRRLVSHSPR